MNTIEAFADGKLLNMNVLNEEYMTLREYLILKLKCTVRLGYRVEYVNEDQNYLYYRIIDLINKTKSEIKDISWQQLAKEHCD